MLKDVHDKSIHEEGERMVPAYHKGAMVYGEHIARYEGIRSLLKGKTVLDIASGSGYGSYILAEEAKHVIGVDIDEPSVEYAKKNYGRKNIEYRVGSAEKIPLEDNSVDAVVTFETVEHIKNYHNFMSEIKRVLKPGGFAVISTPNDLEFPEGNHFHLHEFTHDELKKMLKKYFKYADMSYQYTWLYTAIFSETDPSKEWTRPLDTINAAPVAKDKAIYFTAICSDTALTGAMHIPELGAISEHWSAREQQRQATENEKMIEDKNKEIRLLQHELKTVYNSRSWKLATKLANTKRKLKPGN